MEKEKITLVLPCAGIGKRAGFNKNKLLVEKEGLIALSETLKVAENSGIFDEIVIAAAFADVEEITALASAHKIVLGGATRTDSVKNALAAVDDGIVLIHDGARPFVTEKVFADCVETVKKYRSAVCAVPTRDTVLFSDGDIVSEYIGKSGLYSVQTPQGFFVKDIKKAYELAGGRVFNDDGEVYKEYIGELHIFKGDFNNVKLTYPEDFEKLTADTHYFEQRFGTGFDCHKLTENRKLVLGGVTVPHDKGLLGHSDADVLTHALMDAILSAAGLRDIGYYFPDNDAAYKDADSIKLLKKVLALIAEKGFKVTSVSATIMAEKPKLSPFIPVIKKNLAAVFGVTENKIGLAATTLEGLGFVGREEGICVYAAAVLLSK